MIMIAMTLVRGQKVLFIYWRCEFCLEEDENTLFLLVNGSYPMGYGNGKVLEHCHIPGLEQGGYV